MGSVAGGVRETEGEADGSSRRDGASGAGEEAAFVSGSARVRGDRTEDCRGGGGSRCEASFIARSADYDRRAAHRRGVPASGRSAGGGGRSLCALGGVGGEIGVREVPNSTWAISRV